VQSVARDPEVSEAIERDILDWGTIAETYSQAVLGASAAERAFYVAELAKKRRLISASLEAISDAGVPTISSIDVAHKLDVAIEEALEEKVATGESSDIGARRILEKCLCPPEDTNLLKTGLDALDKITDGFKPGNLIIVGGRPGMGKSIFGLTLADNLHKQGKNVLLFSLEMTRDDIWERQVSFLSHVPLKKIRFQQDKLEGIDKNAIYTAVENLGERTSTFWVDDDSSVTPAQIRQRARAFKKKYGSLDCVVVDYLQIMSPDEKINGNRELEVARMCKSMKTLAKQLETVVVVLSQLNRKSEDRGDKRPSLSDLRESGALEQDADMAILVFRNLSQYVGEDIPPVMETELIVAKNRSGSTGTAVVACETRLTHFANMSHQEEY